MNQKKRKVETEDLIEVKKKLRNELDSVDKTLKHLREEENRDLFDRIAEKLGGTVEHIRNPEDVEYSNECRLDFGRGALDGMYCVIRLPKEKVRIGFGYPKCREGLQCLWYITTTGGMVPDRPLDASECPKKSNSVYVAQSFLSKEKLMDLCVLHTFLAKKLRAPCWGTYNPVREKKVVSVTYIQEEQSKEDFDRATKEWEEVFEGLVQKKNLYFSKKKTGEK
jgi:hypothetical protein